METQKPLLKDEDGEEVDVHMYRSMIGSLMYLTSSRPDIMFAVCACARYQLNLKVSHLNVVKKIFSDYAGASLDRKSTTGAVKMDLEFNAGDSKLNAAGKLLLAGFWTIVKAKTLNEKNQIACLVDGKKIIITESSVRRDLQLADEKPKRKDTQVPQSSDLSENVTDEAVHKELGDSLVMAATTASSLQAKQDSGNINKTQSKDTTNESSSQGTNSGGGPRCQETIEDTTARTRLKLDELMALCTTLQNMVLDLEKTKTTQHNEIGSLKRRVKNLEKKYRSRTYRLKRLHKVGLTAREESSDNEESLGEDASKQGRTDVIDADEEITLVSVQNIDEEMFDVNVLNGEEVFVTEQEVAVKEVNDEVNVVEEVAKVINTAKLIINAAQDSAASDIVSATNASTTTIATITTEHVKPMKKERSNQAWMKEAALKLLAEFVKEKRLARDKAEKEKEANIALIEEWDDIQAKIDADYQLAERMQAQEQEELEDLEDLYKLVKARYGSTRLVESMDYLLWNDMKIMFEPHIEDESMQIYMLVEKKYPLTPPTLSMMLEKKLQIDYESKMAYQLCSKLGGRTREKTIMKDQEHPEKCGETMTRAIIRAMVNKLPEESFSGVSEDKGDLEGIIDYLEPTLYDGFINPNDEAYKQRMNKFLGMPNTEPPLILKEEAEITRYNLGLEKFSQKLKS
ncbi:hypothetical protein Tco_0121054 [Tanacetum coccineum]